MNQGRRKVLSKQSMFGGANHCSRTIACPSNALSPQRLQTPLVWVTLWEWIPLFWDGGFHYLHFERGFLLPNEDLIPNMTSKRVDFFILLHTRGGGGGGGYSDLVPTGVCRWSRQTRVIFGGKGYPLRGFYSRKLRFCVLWFDLNLFSSAICKTYNVT